MVYTYCGGGYRVISEDSNKYNMIAMSLTMSYAVVIVTLFT